jgi:UDPglucose--hexose-1-phosphate uridylyltransferase
MELRKDYLLDRWVVISEARKKRPHEFKKEVKEDVSVCYFCPGNENLTPPEISRVEENGKWKIRVFPNKFSAVAKEGNPEIKTDNKYYTYASAYGSHEVIVETPEHNKSLAHLSEQDISRVLKVYSERVSALSKEPFVKYVSVFKNHGREAGASIIHSHSQVVSLNMIPPLVFQEMHAVRKYSSCPFCEIIENEKRSYRRCFENDEFVAFTPYASRFNYEIWILPKKHILSFTDFDEKKYFDLASILKKILLRLDSIDSPYNLLIHYSPEGGDLHFHIEIAPRLATWAGFEFEDEITINSVSPEDAAKFYRGEEY